MPTRPAKTATAAAPRRRSRLAPEARAAQILDVAARLILEEGLTEVTMERLGREAGISKALIYNYFPNRNELLRALLEREYQLVHARQVEAVRQARDFRDMVYRTTRVYVEHIHERGALLQRLSSEGTVVRSMAEEDQRRRTQAMHFLARLVVKEYGIPMDLALSTVDVQMAMSGAAAQHLARAHVDVDYATDMCVTLLLGGLDALARTHGKAMPKKPPARKTARSSPP